ncbi:MAG: M24 family metallopeptidase [Chloroflexota bacterium]|nr:M24 family metallopeptidase [Chloroflexota bacterium]
MRPRTDEFDAKLGAVRQLMDAHGWDWLLLQSPGSFAWLSGGGRSYIVDGDPRGVGLMLISRQSVHLLAANIELPRLPEEELPGLEIAIESVPWTEFFADPEPAVRGLTGGSRLASDLPFPGAVDAQRAVSEVRSRLGPADIARYRALGADTAAAVEATAREISPGQNEFEAAALLQEKLNRTGIVAPVLLVASDDRIRRHRHPLPVNKSIERYLMLVSCALRDGLWCSITRLVHFGPIDQDLEARALACASVDAAFIAASRPGNRVSDAFAAGRAEYAAQGFAGEWREHHQGGPAGYGSREFFAGAGVDMEIGSGYSFAWNPSIAGVKSEDTVIVGGGPDEPDFEVITETGEWPAIELPGRPVRRPAILQR